MGKGFKGRDGYTEIYSEVLESKAASVLYGEHITRAMWIQGKKEGKVFST